MKEEKKTEELWGFSIELLQHVHTLRLFLLPPAPSSSSFLSHGVGLSSCKISATLHSAPPLLICTLEEQSSSMLTHAPAPPHHVIDVHPDSPMFLVLHLPLPLLLFDYSITPRVSLHSHGHGQECIEISIHLLPLHGSLCHIFSSLSTTAELTTPQPQKYEATDVIADDSLQPHVRKEKPSAIYNLFGRDGKLELEKNCSKDCGIVNLVCRYCSMKISKNPTREFLQMPCAGWRDIVENWFGTCCCLFCSKAEALSTNFEKGFNMCAGRCLLGLSTCYVLLSDTVTELDPMLGCTKDSIYQQSTLRFLDLGNGFMVSESEHSKLSMWIPVHCTGCQSLIGGYPRKTVAPSCSIMEGLHLFQFQIKTDDGLCHAFRYATLEALFGKELQQRTDEGTSYRFLIRSLASEMPLLQIVVLSYGSSLSTGCVTGRWCKTADDARCLKTVNDARCLKTANDAYEVDSSAENESNFDLQRVMKVMFSDCSTFSADERRSTELWVRQQDAEVIYMFDELATRLAKQLHANHLFFPTSCRFSEHFQESFLYT